MHDRLFVLAFDHRTSLMTSFLGVEGEPSPDDVARARQAKRLTWEGLRRALDDGAVPRAAAAVLVDATYGGQVIEEARAQGVRVAMPIEASGRRELAFESGDWRTTIARLRPDWVKVLLRYNPDDEAAMNRRQRSKLREIRQRCRDTGLGLMLELLVPPSEGQLAAAGGDRDRFDREARLGLTVRAIGELRLDEIAPDVWKVEGFDRAEDCRRVAEAAAAPCVVLGRGADRAAVVRWLEAGAGVGSYAGFAIGRSIWWDPLRSFFDAPEAPDATETAVAAIAARYADFVRVYETAAAGR